MLSEEQAKEIKSQLLSQIDKFPEPQKSQAKAQIEEMNAEELEDFLIKNNLIKAEGTEKQLEGKENKESEGKEIQCPFCLIIQGKIPAYKIDENALALAVLEINPLSNGHSIIIPKMHLTTDKIPASSLALAKKVAGKIKSRLKAEDVEISTSSIQVHSIINVIPLYKDQKPEKKKASQEELMRLQIKLEKKTSIKKPKKQAGKQAGTKEEKIIKYNRRIP